MDTENLDLRPIIGLLVRQWKWIAAAVAIPSALAILVSLSQTPTYKAEATLAIAPSRTEVQFDPRIETLADYDLIGGTLQARRISSLVAMVKSNEVVEAVLSEVSSRLSADERSIEWLRNTVSVETAGDLINIQVNYEDPDTAALIANSWIEQFERNVNELYSGRSNVSDSLINEQVSEAQARYQSAQSELEAFIAADPAESLQRELESRTALLENYQQARIAAQARPPDRNQRVLNDYFSELEQIERWLADAEALREQVANDTGSAVANLGNVLALVTLRSRVYSSGQGQMAPEGLLTEGSEAPLTVFNLDPGLQIDLASMPADQVTTADVEALIDALHQRKEAAQRRVREFLGTQTNDGNLELEALNSQISSLSEEVNVLQSQVEAATARERELTQSRDNAWETYQLLVNRQVEEMIASQSLSTEVRIADRAVVPTQPAGRGLVRNTATAAFLGAFISITVILLQAWWNMGDISERTLRVSDEPQSAPEGDARHEEPVSTPGVPDTLSS